MGQIGIDTLSRVIGDSYELIDLKNGYFNIQGPLGYLTVNETGVTTWEPLHSPPHQQFSITGNIATAWPTGEKNVSFPVQVRP